MNRELEVALTERKHVTIDHEANTIPFLLPVSKNDPEAMGCSRAWPCVCSDVGDIFRGCPYHVIVDHLDKLAIMLGTMTKEEDAFPLFPDEKVDFVTS